MINVKLYMEIGGGGKHFYKYTQGKLTWQQRL